MSATARRDSEPKLLPMRADRVRPATADPWQVEDALPRLDLNSTGPLPEFSSPASSSAATADSPVLAELSSGYVAPEPGGSIWLEGNVLMCGCPDCDAPMTIRLWLMVADCWRCATSIELTEEQEKEIQRLLEKREPRRAEAEETRRPAAVAATATNPAPPPRPAPRSSPQPPNQAPASPAGIVAASTTAAPATRERRPAPSVSASPASPNASPSPRPSPIAKPSAPNESPVTAAPAPQRTRSAPSPAPAPAAPPAPPTAPPPASPKVPPRRAPVPAATQPRKANAVHPLDRRARALAAIRRKPQWWERILKEVPAWLVSLVFHMVLLTLLALFTFREETEGIFITLSTVVSREKLGPGEFKVKVDKNDEIVFDLPIPDNMNLKDKKLRDALIEANQAAKELQLDPDLPAPQMANLTAVKELASSDDPIRRSLAVRDPRLRVEVAKKEGGTTLTEAAVARALRWLSEVQHKDGYWNVGPAPTSADTPLALLPFLGAGQTHMAGRYQDTVAKGLRWMMKIQKPNGDLRNGVESHGMYIHGIGAIVLCDAFAMTGDETLRAPAQKALDFISEAQNVGGGWRYTPKQPGDTSVVGWQLMALQSGKMGGLKVAPETLELADHFLDSVSKEDGAKYGYMPRQAPTHVMTAEGLLCRMYLGWNQGVPGLRKGIDFLSANHPPRTGNIYYIYYGTQVMHHNGGPAWEKWNATMRDLLVESQVKQGATAGSWNPAGDQYGPSAGRIFQTSLSACTLEVYYRHAPIFRKIKLE